VKDILIRLRGWAERISGSHRSGVSAGRGAALHPVHLVAEKRALNYVPWKLRKPVARDLRLIYRAATAAG